MRKESDEADLMGLGTDLALSLCGVLILVVVITMSQLLLSSRATKRAEAMIGAAAMASSAARATADRSEADQGELKQKIVHEKEIAERATLVRVNLEGQLANKARDLAEAESIANDLKRQVDLSLSKQGDAERDLAKKARDLAEAESIANDLKRQVDLSQGKQADAERGLEAQNRRVDEEMRKRNSAETALKSANEQISMANNEIKALKQKIMDKPPLIIISDAKFRTFETASAELSPQFRDYLSALKVELIALREKYNATVLEVVGHTDEMGFAASKRQGCNLDESLLEVLNGRISEQVLAPCDNVGLGMARATAVVNELKRDGLGKDFVILPMSAGPAIDTDETLADGSRAGVSLPARRRIEIRLRRRDE